MTTVNVHEAKTNLSRLLLRVMNGEEIIIAKAGKPIAVLSPVNDTSVQRTPGDDAGQVVIKPNFDAPLPIQLSHALHVYTLPDIHQDPFDRLLIAQSQLEKLPLLTADADIARYTAVANPRSAM